MILKVAGAAQHGVVIDAQVRTTDILPTILSLAKIPAPAELNGESMMPLIQQQAATHDLLAETDYPLRFGWAPLKALSYGHSPLRLRSSKSRENPPLPAGIK